MRQDFQFEGVELNGCSLRWNFAIEEINTVAVFMGDSALL
jgi:hypothetical protein